MLLFVCYGAVCAFAHTSCRNNIQLTIYNDEERFHDIVSLNTTDSLVFKEDDPLFTSGTYEHKGIVTRGSIIVPVTGDYQFKLDYSGYAQFTFLDVDYPRIFEAGTTCTPGEVKSIETEVVHLESTSVYPFSLRMRTGSVRYSKYAVLMWKNGPKYNGHESAKWEEIPASVIFDCNCKPGFYGDLCNELCRTDTECFNQGTCYEGKCYCRDGYYGEHCDIFCDSMRNCSNHGLCNDRGQCVCSNGYTGLRCDNTNDETSLENGVIYTKYSNETLTDAVEGPKLLRLAHFDMSVDQFTYQSAVVKGSVYVTERGNYSLKFTAKPYGQVRFAGKTYPIDLGPSGSCDDSAITEEETDALILIPHKRYPFTITYLSGCAAVSHALKLAISRDGGPYETMTSANLLSASTEGCEPLYYGATCENECTTDCHHGQCIENGVCKCDTDYYGEKCDTRCVAEETCNRAGICLRNGSCSCADGYTGKYCNISIPDTVLNGYSLSCPPAATISWYSNEYFGLVKDVTSFAGPMKLDIDPDVDFRALTITGSLSPPTAGRYRFRAAGFPTVELQIAGINCTKTAFRAGTCSPNVSEKVVCDAASLEPGKMLPFRISYRSGCGGSARSLNFQYQLSDGGDWQDVTFVRDCVSEDCERGMFGDQCNGVCPDCGEHGFCQDGRVGDGRCICQEWYAGSRCGFNMFPLLLGIFGGVLTAALILVCWPVNPDKTHGNMNEITLQSQDSCADVYNADFLSQNSLLPGQETTYT